MYEVPNDGVSCQNDVGGDATEDTFLQDADIPRHADTDTVERSIYDESLF